MLTKAREDVASKQAAYSAALKNSRIAVLVPCYNEQHTVGRGVADFRSVLPSTEVYVYDNNSTDSTIAIAREAGATVRREGRQGKGNVVRRMFADVDADIYVMVDGDGTYETPGGSPDQINVSYDHLRGCFTLLDESLGRSKAYTAASTGDHCNFSVKSFWN